MVDGKLPLVFQVHPVNVNGRGRTILLLRLRRHHDLRLDHVVVGEGFGGQPTASAEIDSSSLCSADKLPQQLT